MSDTESIDNASRDDATSAWLPWLEQQLELVGAELSGLGRIVNEAVAGLGAIAARSDLSEPVRAEIVRVLHFEDLCRELSRHAATRVEEIRAITEQARGVGRTDVPSSALDDATRERMRRCPVTAHHLVRRDPDAEGEITLF
ncbi:MAG: hypothetical protein KDC38_19555 [Planctomycetes bacterium]|nr:hypothetical protein [Planctomycetota bacterium]